MTRVHGLDVLVLCSLRLVRAHDSIPNTGHSGTPKTHISWGRANFGPRSSSWTLFRFGMSKCNFWPVQACTPAPIFRSKKIEILPKSRRKMEVPKIGLPEVIYFTGSKYRERSNGGAEVQHLRCSATGADLPIFSGWLLKSSKLSGKKRKRRHLPPKKTFIWMSNFETWCTFPFGDVHCSRLFGLFGPLVFFLSMKMEQHAVISSQPALGRGG